MKRTHSLFLSLLTLTLTLTIFPNAAALAQTAAPNEAPAKAQPTAGATAGAGASTAAAASAAAVADAVAVAVRVDIAQPTGARIHRELFGTAFIANAKRVHEPLVRRQLAALGVPVTSVSVGWIGHVRKSADGPADWRELDTMLVGLREMGLGTEATPLQFAVGGPGKWFDVKNERHRQIWADTLAEAARHCAKARVRVAWWELWNEPDGIFGQSANARYLDLWRYYIAASRALKGVDPTLQIGGPGLAWPHGSVIFDYFKHCGKDVDFISYHQYSTGNYKTTTRQFLDNAAPHFGKEAASISRSIKRAAAAGFLKTPTTSLPIFLTEYNMNYGWDPGEKRQQTPAGVVYTAIALFEAGSNGLQRAAIWSAIGNSQFGLVHGDHTAPSGYLLRKLADWAPGNLVKTTVGVGAADAGKPAAAAKPAAPLVRAYATADAGTRHLTVVLINTSETQTAAVDLTLADGGTSATAASAKNFGQAQVFVVNADNPAGAARVLPPPLGKVALPPLTVKVLRFGGR